MHLKLEAARLVEHAKYERCYEAESYRMGARRMADAVRELEAIPSRGRYLDVGCGCGEMLGHAEALGFTMARGTEIVPKLIDGAKVVRAEVHALPFKSDSFDVVTMFDVIEHLIPGDDELACRELARVASKHVLLSANNMVSFNLQRDDLHINKRPYEEWDMLFREWFPGNVIWLGARDYVSECWRIDL